MAKVSLPSVDDFDGPAPAKKKASQPVPKPKSTEPAKPAEGYVSRRVDASLTRKQGIALRDKLRELQDAGAVLENGRFVSTKTHAIQWVLENM